MARENDAVDALVQAWRNAQPGLDPRHLHVLGRVSRIEAAFRRRVDAWLAPLGLSWDMFDLMATLWRAPDHAMRPGELSRWCLLSSGAMTKRIDRVVAAGLARREPDPGDRRAQLVRLTAAGVTLAERAVPLHFGGAQEVVGILSEPDLKNFTLAARKLLLSLEGPKDGTAPNQPPAGSRAPGSKGPAG